MVDDFPSVRHYHSFVLKNAGFQCEVAHDGREALAHLHQHPVDLVILDLITPEMRGEEFLRQLHGNPTWAGVAVLVISSEQIGERIRQARTPTAGPVGFVRKPLLPATILAEVKELMG